MRQSVFGFETVFLVWLFVFSTDAEAGPVTSMESPMMEVDCRTGFGGALVRGQIRISPVAAAKPGSAGLFRVEGQQPEDWSGSSPFWNSASLADGWHEVSLEEPDGVSTARLAVLNSGDAVIHSGMLKTDEIWAADRLHIVRHWVRIPAGRTLTIEDGSVVKFCPDTGLQADGVLNARQVMFTASSDDSVAGDTDMDGAADASAGASYQISGSGTLNLIDCRQRYDQALSWQVKLQRGWNLVSFPWGMIESRNADLLKQWAPVKLQEKHWQPLQLPVPAGTACWIYSSGEDIIDFVFSEKKLNSAPQQPGVTSGYAGICGSAPLVLPAGSATKIWQWKDGSYERLQPEADGGYVLRPGIGYVFY